MDQKSHHPSVSPLFVGLLGVVSGAIIVATFHCIVASCRYRAHRRESSPTATTRTHALITTNLQHQEPPSTASSGNSITISTSSIGSSSSAAASSTTSTTLMLAAVHKYSADRFKEGCCAVCLGEFQEEDEVRVLPQCAHVFHKPCIDMWLYSHSNCPLCRANIMMITTPPRTSTTHHHLVLSISEPSYAATSI